MHSSSDNYLLVFSQKSRPAVSFLREVRQNKETERKTKLFPEKLDIIKSDLLPTSTGKAKNRLTSNE